VTEAALSLGNRIGRYFSLASMLPALLLVLWTYAIFASGAWSGRPDPAEAWDTLSHWSAAGVGWILVATLAVALFLHPLQFVTTQLLEGYWGSSALARGAMARRVLYHRRRRATLGTFEERHQDSWLTASDHLLLQQFEEDKRLGIAGGDEAGPSSWDDAEWDRRRVRLLDSSAGDEIVLDLVAEDAARRSWSRYPEGRRVMPTRLGNALRRFEDAAGAQYGLDAILTAPHFSMIAPDRHVQYIRDSRQQMDTTIRLCTVSLLGTVLAVASLLTDGRWLLVALVPYALAYIAYRGAIAAADEYATAVTTVIDLDRFLLYEKLQVEIPKDTNDERTVNASLILLLSGDEQVNVRYRHDRGAVETRRRGQR
jgi:hypothetical protein